MGRRAGCLTDAFVSEITPSTNSSAAMSSLSTAAPTASQETLWYGCGVSFTAGGSSLPQSSDVSHLSGWLNSPHALLCRCTGCVRQATSMNFGTKERRSTPSSHEGPSPLEADQDVPSLYLRRCFLFMFPPLHSS